MTAPSPTPDLREPHGAPDALLHAVREEVLRYGVRRASVTSIAQRAGVSRMTVYRRGGGLEQLVLDAVVQEFRSVLAQATAQATGETGRARLVSTVLLGLRGLAGAPLTAALRRHDPDLLMPYLVQRHGSNQNLIRETLAALIRAGQADGSVRAVAPGTASLILLHATQDFVISSEILEQEADWDTLNTELAHLIDRYLAP